MNKIFSALRKLGPFLMGVILGVDMGIGLIVFWVFGVITKEVSITNLLFCVFMAHAPDLDMALYMVPTIKKKLPYPSHRVIGHHPVLILPLFIIIGMWALVFLPVETWVLQGIILLAAHFVHDMTDSTGLHLISPFSWKRWRLDTKGIHTVPQDDVDRRFNPATTKFGGGGISEFASRAEPFSIVGATLVLTGVIENSMLFYYSMR